MGFWLVRLAEYAVGVATGGIKVTQTDALGARAGRGNSESCVRRQVWSPHKGLSGRAVGPHGWGSSRVSVHGSRGTEDDLLDARMAHRFQKVKATDHVVFPKSLGCDVAFADLDVGREVDHRVDCVL